MIATGEMASHCQIRTDTSCYVHSVQCDDGEGCVKQEDHVLHGFDPFISSIAIHTAIISIIRKLHAALARNAVVAIAEWRP